jgi:transposase InsO family protein
MALRRRTPRQGGIIHSDQGVQFASWVFSQKVTEAGLAPSVGAVGAPFDNAMVEAFWARMQVEPLNRRRWKTRIELVECQATFAVLMSRFRRGLSVLRLRQWMYRRMRRAWVAWSGWSVPASVKYLSARNCASILFSQEA